MRGKEKMLVTRDSPFPHNVFFFTFLNTSAYFSGISLSSANDFDSTNFEIYHLIKTLTLSQKSPGFYVSAVQVF